MTPLIVLLAALGILVMLGAAITFSWLCGQAAGGAVKWAMDAGQPKPYEPAMTPQELAEIDDLIRQTRKEARLPPIN